MLNYLPKHLHKIKEYQQIVSAEQPQLTRGMTDIRNTLNEQFLETATDYGLKRHAKIVGVRDYTDLQFSILTKINERLPHTWRTLLVKLNNIIGENEYLINLQNLTLDLKIKLTKKNRFYLVKKNLTEILPANIELNLELLFNTHQKIKKYTHEQLSRLTHKQIRSDVLSEHF